MLLVGNQLNRERNLFIINSTELSELGFPDYFSIKFREMHSLCNCIDILSDDRVQQYTVNTLRSLSAWGDVGLIF